jgi:hypothetical protein
MRDPERIPMILAAVEREWRKAPDLRLGQLLVNLVREHAGVPREEEGTRLFAVQDGVLLRWLGPADEAEVTYITEEPTGARAAWQTAVGPTAEQSRRRIVTPPNDADQTK